MPTHTVPLTTLTAESRISETLLTKKQLAPHLSLKVRGVECLVAARRIPVIRISSRCVRFSLPKVLAALNRLEIKEVT